MASTKKGDRLHRKGDRLTGKKGRLTNKQDRLRGILRDFVASPSGLGAYLGTRKQDRVVGPYRPAGGVLADVTNDFQDRPSRIATNTSQLRGSPTIAVSPAEIAAAESAMAPMTPSRVAPVSPNTSQLRGSPMIATTPSQIANAEVATGMRSMPTFKGIKEDRVPHAAPKQARLGAMPTNDELSEIQKHEAQFRSLPPDRPMPNGTPNGVMKTSFGTMGTPVDDGYQPSSMMPDQIAPGDVNAGGALKGLFSAGAATGPNAYGVVDPGQAPMGPNGVADPFGNYKPAGGVMAATNKQPERLALDPTTVNNPTGANPVETGSPPYTPPAAPDMPPAINVPDRKVAGVPQAIPSDIPSSFAANFAKQAALGLTKTISDAPTIGTKLMGVMPAAPELSMADTIANSPRAKRDLKAAQIAGLPGVLGSELGTAISRWAGEPMGGDIEPNAVGRIADAMGGARGSLGRSLSNPGSSYLSLGPNNGGIYTSGKYGWKEVWGPDGSPRSTHYGPNQGGILGAISRAVGEMFGDRGYGRASGKVDNDYFSEHAGPW